MNDVLTTEQRKYCMSRIQGKNTKPELTLRKILWKNNLRYRMGDKVFGKPDIIFVRKKIAIFVDGCFWHGCPEHYTKPKTNKIFWEKKILNNKLRDQRVNQSLKSEGWIVIRFWEHQIGKDLNSCVKTVSDLLLKRK